MRPEGFGVTRIAFEDGPYASAQGEIGFVFGGDLAVTRYFSLFPMVILAGMIERFWTLETEDGTASSFKTLLGTMQTPADMA